MNADYIATDLQGSESLREWRKRTRPCKVSMLRRLKARVIA